MAELTLPATMEGHQGQMPSSLQNLLQRRAFAKKRPISCQNEHWSVQNVEARPVNDAATFTFNINNDIDNWNNFYKVCGDLSTKYGERATKRRAIIDNAAEVSSQHEKPHYHNSTVNRSASTRDSVIEQLLTNEIKTIEQTKSLLNLERIKLQMELLRLLDERLKVANQQDDAAVEALKLWQNRSIKNTMQSELAKRALGGWGGAPSSRHDHDIPTERQATPTTQVIAPSKLSLSTASKALLERIVQEHSALMTPKTLPEPRIHTRPHLDIPKKTAVAIQTDLLSTDGPHALLLRHLRREEHAKQL